MPTPQDLLYANGWLFAVANHIKSGGLWIPWDGAVTVSGGSGDGAILDGVTSSIRATVLNYTNGKPLAISLTDANGDHIITLPVSAASLPLPSGAATQVTLASILAALDVALSTRASQATLASVLAALTLVPVTATDLDIRNLAFAQDKVDVSGSSNVGVTGTFFQATQPVSVASLPLPSGASTEATLALIKAKTDNIDVALSTRTKPADAQHAIIDSGTITAVTAITNALPAGTNAIGKLAANSGVDIGDATLNNGAADETNGLFATADKVLASSTYAPTRFADLGSNATANVKNATGNVLSLYCNNENAADRYIQLHNTTTTPGAGATPLYTFRVPAGGDTLIGTDFFTNNGANFSIGIAFAFSTTKDTYTAATAGDQSTIIHYK